MVAGLFRTSRKDVSIWVNCCEYVADAVNMFANVVELLWTLRKVHHKSTIVTPLLWTCYSLVLD